MQDSGFTVWNLELRVEGLGLRFYVSGFGFRFNGLGFRV